VDPADEILGAGRDGAVEDETALLARRDPFVRLVSHIRETRLQPVVTASAQLFESLDERLLVLQFDHIPLEGLADFPMEAAAARWGDVGGGGSGKPGPEGEAAELEEVASFHDDGEGSEAWRA